MSQTNEKYFDMKITHSHLARTSFEEQKCNFHSNSIHSTHIGFFSSEMYAIGTGSVFHSRAMKNNENRF